MQQGERQPGQRREFLDASPQLQDLLPELRLRKVATSKLTTSVGTAASHPRAVERGTPRSVVTGDQQERAWRGLPALTELIAKVVNGKIRSLSEACNVARGVTEADLKSLNATLVDPIKFANLIAKSSVVSF